MKFKIKGESKKEHTIELWLEGNEEGSISLMGGDEGYVVTLMKFKDGQFQRPNGAGLEGLKTDDKGRIEELK